jgi:hypothetical protein
MVFLKPLTMMVHTKPSLKHNFMLIVYTLVKMSFLLYTAGVDSFNNMFATYGFLPIKTVFDGSNLTNPIFVQIYTVD